MKILFRSILCLSLYALLAGSAAPAGNSAIAGELDAAALFRQVESRFQNVKTLAYTVKRATVSSKMKTEERWLFRFQEPDLLRIDYQAPHERVIIIDGSAIWEYIPSLRKAAKTDLASLSAEQKKRKIAEVMSHVSVDGLHLGNFESMAKNAVQMKAATWAGRQAWLVEGVDPRYAVYIDKERAALLRTEIFDPNGKLILRTEASRFSEAGPGFWMPGELRITYGSKDGFVQSTVSLQDVRVNAPFADDLFRFSAPKGVEVILH